MAESASPLGAAVESLTHRRRMVMLNAAWEQEALLGLVRGMTRQLPHGPDGVRLLLLQLRGIVARASEVNSVVMMALCDDVADDAYLERQLHRAD